MKNSLYSFILALLFTIALPAAGEGRLYFLHVQKTGGTTLRLLLEQQVAMSEIYPYRNNREARSSVKEDLVSGHISYSFCKKIDKDFEQAFKVTILRDPVERFLSFLRAKKKADPTLPNLEAVLEWNKHRRDKYRYEIIDNGYCRFYADDPNLQGEALLESAINNLQKIDCVLFFDHYTDDATALFERLGIDLDPRDIPTINTTKKEPVSDKLLDEVIRLNEWDIKLYEYAKTYLQPKDSQYRLRNASFDELMKTVPPIDYTFDLPLNGRGWTFRDTECVPSNDNLVYRWVMDYPASIYFNLEEGNDYNLTFYAYPLTDEVVPQVEINGIEIAITGQYQGSFSPFTARIPKEIITDKPTEVKFYASKAYEFRTLFPKKLNRNLPPLSFAVNRIQIEARSSVK